MQIVIPMAGYGKRLHPHTFSRPKPLLHVAGRPMLQFILDALSRVHIDEYIFIVGYLGDQIEDYIHTQTNIQARFVVQKEMLGQSHAVYLARDYIHGPTLILFADTLFEADLSVIEQTDADGIAFIKEVEDPSRFGVVELDKSGNVTRFIEKPSSRKNKQAVIGFYYIRDSAAMLDALGTQIAEKRMTQNEYFLTDGFQIMIDKGAKFRTQGVDTWLDFGKPDTVLQTNHYLLDHGYDTNTVLSQKNVAVIPPVNIDPTAMIEDSVIGPHATISANCIISRSIITDSVVDAGAEVRNMLLNQSLVGREAKLTGRPVALNIGDESIIDT